MRIFAFIPLTSPAGTAQVLGTNIIAGDSRALLLNLFFERYKSPMTPYSQLIVEQADAWAGLPRVAPKV